MKKPSLPTVFSLREYPRRDSQTPGFPEEYTPPARPDAKSDARDARFDRLSDLWPALPESAKVLILHTAEDAVGKAG